MLGDATVSLSFPEFFWSAAMLWSGFSKFPKLTGKASCGSWVKRIFSEVLPSFLLFPRGSIQIYRRNLSILVFLLRILRNELKVLQNKCWLFEPCRGRPGGLLTQCNSIYKRCSATVYHLFLPWRKLFANVRWRASRPIQKKGENIGLLQKPKMLATQDLFHIFGFNSTFFMISFFLLAGGCRRYFENHWLKFSLYMSSFVLLMFLRTVLPWAWPAYEVLSISS